MNQKPPDRHLSSETVFFQVRVGRVSGCEFVQAPVSRLAGPQNWPLVQGTPETADVSSSPMEGVDVHPDDLASIEEWGHYGVGTETEAYQAYLEGHRADPDDEQIYQDMLKAKAAMEVAWLKHHR